MIRGILAALMVYLILPPAAHAELPAEDSFQWLEKSGGLIFRVAASDSERHFFPLFRINYRDGTVGAASYGCFPFDCPPDFSPMGSTSGSPIFSPIGESKTIASIDLFWRSDQTYPGDKWGFSYSEARKIFEDLTNDGAGSLRLFPAKES